MTNARKSDTHQKIQLGGLVVKAGLRDADKAIILGALLELSKQIENDSPMIVQYRSAGDSAFKEDMGNDDEENVS